MTVGSTGGSVVCVKKVAKKTLFCCRDCEKWVHVDDDIFVCVKYDLRIKPAKSFVQRTI